MADAGDLFDAVDAFEAEAHASAYADGIAAGAQEAFTQGYRFGCLNGWQVGIELGKARGLAEAVLLLCPADAQSSLEAAATDAQVPPAVASGAPSAPLGSGGMQQAARVARTATQLRAMCDAFPLHNKSDIDVVAELQRISGKAKVLAVTAKALLGVDLTALPPATAHPAPSSTASTYSSASSSSSTETSSAGATNGSRSNGVPAPQTSASGSLSF